MSQIINLPWLSRTLEVTESSDQTLVGISGTVVDETKRTILVNTGVKEVTLAKDTIRFTIENEEIDGTIVGQRPEERIGKAYRRS
jgi:ribonuclease P protein subunit POP4|tara:strand:+ start:142 stop:396 length:255 start_codon:yes stop_codon:yes gene_type:complete